MQYHMVLCLISKWIHYYVSMRRYHKFSIRIYTRVSFLPKEPQYTAFVEQTYSHKILYYSSKLIGSIYCICGVIVLAKYRVLQICSWTAIAVFCGYNLTLRKQYLGDILFTCECSIVRLYVYSQILYFGGYMLIR